MHDPTSLFRFEEHDIYLPMLTLEELDNNKKGMTEVARNARQASRFLDELVGTRRRDVERACRSRRRAIATRPAGSVPADRAITHVAAGRTLARRQGRQPDPRRRARARRRQRQERQVILVSKDINMRIKARALGLAAEDYFNDKVLEDTDLLYTGMRELPADFWDRTARAWKVVAAGPAHLLPRDGPAVPVAAGQRVRLPGAANGEPPLYAIVKEVTGKTALLQTLQGLHAPEEQRVGHHRAQPRAEFRAQPADESGDRFRHAARPGRHRQDAADARRRP